MSRSPLPLALCVALLGGCSLFEDSKDEAPQAAAQATPVEEGADPLAPPPSAEAPAASKPTAPAPGPKPAERAPEPAEPAPAPKPAGPAPSPQPTAELTPAPPPGSDRRVTVFARELDVRVAGHMIGTQAGIEIDLAPAVKGRVTLSLQDQPWRRALERLLAQVGEFEIRGQGDLVQVEPRPLLVEGTVASRDAESVTVRRDDETAVTCFLPEAGSEDRQALAELLETLAPGAQVSLVCDAPNKRLILRSAVSSR